MRELRAGGDQETAAAFVAGLDLHSGARPGLPRVVAIMVAAIDGRATIDGGSRELGHPEDRALLRGLRAEADCMLAGTRTLAAEGYARLLDEEQREARVAEARTPDPLVATVSRSGAIPWGAAVFGEEAVEKQVYVGSPVTVPAGVRRTAVEVAAGGPRAALADLHARRGVRSVACEGGPRLLRALIADGLVDDLLLTVAPLLVAGEGPTAVTGAAFDVPRLMRLRGVRRADDHLFLHYAR